MPNSRFERLLCGRWPTLVARAGEFRGSMPIEGLTRAEYSTAVLFDADPLLIDDILARLHRRKLVWCRRSRGVVRLYPSRPPQIHVEKGIAVCAEGQLCKAIAGHMLALSKAETLRRRAADAADHDANARYAAEAGVHSDRVLAIVSRHAADGLSLSDVRLALHATFAQPALTALVRRRPTLALSATSEALQEFRAPPRARRLSPGLSLKQKVFEHIAAAGPQGATSTRLMDAIRPKPSAADLVEVSAKLEAEELIVSREVRTGSRGRPARRFFIRLPPQN